MGLGNEERISEVEGKLQGAVDEVLGDDALPILMSSTSALLVSILNRQSIRSSECRSVTASGNVVSACTTFPQTYGYWRLLHPYSATSVPYTCVHLASVSTLSHREAPA